jgi:hypothetical protein
MVGGDCSKPAEKSNAGFILRWEETKESQQIQMYGHIHADIFILPLFLLPGVKLHIKLTKAKKDFYLLSGKVAPQVYFKFEEALLYSNESAPAPLF